MGGLGGGRRAPVCGADARAGKLCRGRGASWVLLSLEHAGRTATLGLQNRCHRVGKGISGRSCLGRREGRKEGGEDPGGHETPFQVKGSRGK